MGLNVKSALSNGLEKAKTVGKKTAATLATVAALSGVLTSCNYDEVKASGNTVTAGFKYEHSNGGSAEPTIDQYNVEIKKVGDKCIATIDGDRFDDKTFEGEPNTVFLQVADFLTAKAEIVTQSPEVTENTQNKVDAMKELYDKLPSVKKK